jgi:paraquat-inducible protein B
MKTHPHPDSEDHGVVVPTHRRTVAWVWIFPVIAALTTAWLLWNDFKTMGPEIEITFAEAPGIQAGKTHLVYRGVNSGTVKSVELDENLDKVVVRIQLKDFAAGLATEDTDFWVERPVITLTELAGIESIIQGNSIRARNPGGAPKDHFSGLSKPPLLPLLPGAFTVRLQGAEIPYLDRGTPVYHRGVKVGYVREKLFDAEGKPEIQLTIEPDHRSTLHTTSRFWPMSATALTLGQHGFKLDIQSVDALVHGAILFDHFEKEGMEASNESLFELSQDEFAARCSGRLITITFDDARGLLTGETPVCYLGQPVGLVEAIAPDPASGLARVAVRLTPAFDTITDSATVFAIVRPRISLEGISGLETLLTGTYISLSPGLGGKPSELFVGRSVTDEEWTRLQAERQGVPFSLTAENLPTLGKGAPVMYRGVIVGTILGKTLQDGKTPMLQGIIRAEFRDALDANARFWRVPATSLKAGPGFLKMDVAGLQGLLQGGVAFDVFGPQSIPAAAGAEFPLFPDEENARAISPSIRISFINGRGLLPGNTELRYLGVPVGIVEAATPDAGKVQVTARLNAGYEFLRREGTRFAIVRPNISLQGITGLETLISGVYIECTPGNSNKPADTFIGQSTLDASEILQSGLSINLLTNATPLNAGATINYRGIVVGRITGKSLSSDGRQINLALVIEEKYSHLVRTNSQFWDSSGIKAKLGFLKVHIETDSIMAPDGRISFATPDNASMGAPAKDGATFPLNAAPRPEWLKWDPTIPIAN